MKRMEVYFLCAICIAVMVCLRFQEYFSMSNSSPSSTEPWSARGLRQKELSVTIRDIFFVIITGRRYHDNRCKWQQETWLKHVVDYEFITTKSNSTLPPRFVGVDVGDPNSKDMFNIHFPNGVHAAGAGWTPPMAVAWMIAQRKWLYALAHICESKELDSYKWYVIVDDDALVVVRNLLRVLKGHDFTTPLFLGWPVFPENRKPVLHGGGGYYMSRELVKNMCRGVNTKDGGPCLDYYEREPTIISEGAMAMCADHFGGAKPQLLPGVYFETWEHYVESDHFQKVLKVEELATVHHLWNKELFDEAWQKYYVSVGEEEPGLYN